MVHSKYFHCAKQTSHPHLPHVPRRPESRNACVCLSKTREDPENHIKNDVQGNTKKLTKKQEKWRIMGNDNTRCSTQNLRFSNLLPETYCSETFRQPSQQIGSVFQFSTRNLLSFWVHLWKDMSAGLGRAVIKRYWMLLRHGIPYRPWWNISHWVIFLNANWGTITYQVYPDILQSVVCVIFTPLGTWNGIAKK